MTVFKTIGLGFVMAACLGLAVKANSQPSSASLPETTTIPITAIETTIPQSSNPQLTKAQFTKSKSSPKSVQDKRLEKIHQKIQTSHPDLRHISRSGLQTWLAQNDPDILLLDTRPLSEYKVSHIQGAMQIDPDSQVRKLSTLPLDGKTVIVYCSVGRRSSNFATRLETELSDAGAKTVLNLEGGVFGWHNDGRALVNTNGQTDMIHPYNAFWGSRYLADKNKITYSLK